MNKERRYLIFLLLSIALYATVEIMKPKPVDWSMDYTKDKSIPFSTKILYNELTTLFPNSEISLNLNTIFVSQEDWDEPNNYIFINSGFEFAKLEAEVLLEQLNLGSQIFIAGPISGFLADTLNLEYDLYLGSLDSTILEDSISISINSPYKNLNGYWKYNSEETFFYISSYDSSLTTELGHFKNQYLNFIKIDFGNGTLYLNSTPLLFTNYYLRNPKQAPYAFSALSHLPIKSTVWDEYYKNGKASSGTPLYVILSTESLKYAWYLSIISLFLFMIFKAKRKQRVIPIIKSPENSTLNFTKTVGMLYLEQGSHSSILEKKIQFFFDYLNTHLRMDITLIDEKFKTDLANRSGIAETEITKIFDLIDIIRQTKKISDTELKLVTDSIDNFYKNSQR